MSNPYGAPSKGPGNSGPAPSPPSGEPERRKFRVNYVNGPRAGVGPDARRGGSGRGPALAVGVVAAVLGGGAWAAIVAWTGYELGIVAWGIGGAVGTAMAAATAERSTSLAAAAAVFSMVGLLVGKSLIGVVVLPGALAESIAADEQALASAAFWDLEAEGGVPGLIQAQLDALGPEDTLSDALWTDMLEVGKSRIDAMSETERTEFVASFSGDLVGSAGPLGRILWQLSLYDLLWFGLALSTAWGIMNRASDASGPGTESLDAAGRAPSAVG